MCFSLFFTVVNAASSAFPGREGFPPFPSDQEMQGEDFPEEEKDEDEDEEMLPPPPMPPKDSDKVFYYRGNRAYAEELPLKVKFVKCIRDEDGNIIVMLVFNQSVNPRSVKHESVLIDNNELPEEIRFSFNRKGDTIRIVITLEEDEFTMEDEEFLITLQDITTFEGVCIEPVELLAKVED